mmetsp:Transcript_47271/g.101194  ORF Transcript_47271/g.101194 Transcript_47271/m.101194 type:complete len:483 (-) Transcript_47271:57-1505(-)
MGLFARSSFLPLRFFVATAISSLLSSVSGYREEDNVLVLDTSNFATAIQEHRFLLVEFYAPWCGHCKHFAPEYAMAAKVLKGTSPAVPLAKVDATTETKLTEEFGVRGYPTIRLFIDGKDQEYTGGRTSDGVVTWVKKKVGPAAVQLTSIATAQEFQSVNPYAVIGFFEEAFDRSGFESAARQLESVMFGYVSSPAVAAGLGAEMNSAKMTFPHDEKVATFAGDLRSANDMEKFARAYSFPLVNIFSGDIAGSLFNDGRPMLVLFRDKESKGLAAEEAFKKAMGTIGRKYLACVTGSSEPMDQRFMDFVSVEPEELPTVRLLLNPAKTMTKYRLEGEIHEQSIISFVSAQENGKLQPHMKSEPVPTTQSGPVLTLVGTNFWEVVRDPTKNVLVEFYAPWCGHCKKMEPVYKEVAKRLEHNEEVIIAKIDATANDIDGVTVEGFPTIKLWRAGKKDQPVDYDGDRDVDGFLSWLQLHASRQEL